MRIDVDDQGKPGKPTVVSGDIAWDVEIATHIYLAILTDTGSFRHSHITARTFEACRRVAEAGVDPAEIARLVYEQSSVGKLKLIGALLEGMETSSDGRLAILSLDDELMRQCYAGSDLLVMPSLVEPGGTNQLIALRYGTLPLVRATGGLADTVTNIDMQAGVGTGFVFSAPETQELYGTLLRALELYRHPAIWQAAMGRAMRADWSWRRTAEEYDDLYRRALASRMARRPRSSYGES